MAKDKIPDTWQIKSKGQVTIKKKIMKCLGWDDNDYLDVEVDRKKKTIILKKCS